MRSIPDDNLAFPVLVIVGTSSGSGFYLNAPDAMYLVTAKHALFDLTTNNLLSNTAQLLSYCQDPSDKGSITFDLDLLKLHAAGNIYSHPDKDVAAIKVCTMSPKNDKGLSELIIQDGASINNTSKGHIIGVPLNLCKKIDDVLVSNQVFAFGYPVSIGIKQNPQFDYKKPLLKNGIVAGKNEESGTIILDCTVFPGNSGGPVIEIETEGTNIAYRTIGVVTQFIPMAETWENTTLKYSNTNISNSGYSVIVSMDHVFDMLGLVFDDN